MDNKIVVLVFVFIFFCFNEAIACTCLSSSKSTILKSDFVAAGRVLSIEHLRDSLVNRDTNFPDADEIIYIDKIEYLIEIIDVFKGKRANRRKRLLRVVTLNDPDECGLNLSIGQTPILGFLDSQKITSDMYENDICSFIGDLSSRTVNLINLSLNK